ncbi:MAG: hypothetical protein ACUVRJ_10415 [Candidatus Villigracilaceae bacterium]
MTIQLSKIVADFAAGIKRVDERRPQYVNHRSKKPFQAGIGPHSEAQVVKLVTDEMNQTYNYSIKTNVPYPGFPRQKCDFCIGNTSPWEWAIEVKMLRFLGDNGKPNDNILMHILSPYPQHKSALTDCTKLSSSQLANSKAILIYGYEHDDWPLDPAIEAFEILAKQKVRLGPRCEEKFSGLIHPIHKCGRVFGWQL